MVRNNLLPVFVIYYQTLIIFQAVLSAAQMGVADNVKIPGYEGLIVERTGTASQLTRLQRQFLNYNKLTIPDTPRIASLFVHYLNKSL